MFREFTIDTYYSDGTNIGNGAFADVFLGYNTIDNTNVAIKVIKPQFEKKSDKHKAQLNTEIIILQQMQHPNIVKCYDISRHQSTQRLCMILEYCSGGNLYTYLKEKKGKLTEYRIQHIIKQLVNGLKYLKKLNIIHRDLKPENLLIHYETTTNNKIFTLKIADFGLSKIINSSDDLAETQCGSKLYMAPEIVLGKSYDYKVDLWSVGSILFRLITAKPLFSVLPPINRFLYNSYIYSESMLPHDNVYSNQIKDFLKKLLINDPNKRIEWVDFIKHPFIMTERIKGNKRGVIDEHSNCDDLKKLQEFNLKNSLFIVSNGDDINISDIINDTEEKSNDINKFVMINCLVSGDELSNRLTKTYNKILAILRLGNKKYKKEIYQDAYLLYIQALKSLKILLTTTKNDINSNKKLLTDLVNSNIKDIYNTFNHYLLIINSLLSKFNVDDKINNNIKYIVIKYIIYASKKAEINEYFHKKSKNKYTHCILCLEYLLGYGDIDNTLNGNNEEDITYYHDFDFIIKNKKITDILIKYYINIFNNKIQTI